MSEPEKTARQEQRRITTKRVFVAGYREALSDIAKVLLPLIPDKHSKREMRAILSNLKNNHPMPPASYARLKRKAK